MSPVEERLQRLEQMNVEADIRGFLDVIERNAFCCDECTSGLQADAIDDALEGLADLLRRIGVLS